MFAILCLTVFELINADITHGSEHGQAAPHVPGPQLPYLIKVHPEAFPLGNVLHLLGNVLLSGSLDINELGVTGAVVARHSFPKK